MVADGILRNNGLVACSWDGSRTGLIEFLCHDHRGKFSSNKIAANDAAHLSPLSVIISTRSSSNPSQYANSAPTDSHTVVSGDPHHLLPFTFRYLFSVIIQ